MLRCKQAELALASDETPVGCVFVHGEEIIGRGMNDTNKSLNVSNCLLICCLACLKDATHNFNTGHALCVNVPPNVHSGHETCRIHGHLSNPRDSPRLHIALHRSLRDRRAMCNVRIYAPPVRYPRRLLRLL